MHASEPVDLTGKWRNLAILSVAELLAMVLWFSASAVVPQLTAEWGLSGSERSWMTMSVQVGFVVGALLSAALNLPDRVSTRFLVAASTLGGALCTAAIVLVGDAVGGALLLRAATGVCLAGVYPPGMKLMASWCKEDRGLGIGVLVGALTIGSAMPHLLNAMPGDGDGGMPPWRTVLLFAAGLAFVGALLAAFFVREGPYAVRAATFHWRHAAQALSHRPTRLANFGYLGHMWELYAMWTWVPILLIASYEAAGRSVGAARVAAFAAIGAGAIGCVVGGQLADRMGRTTITVASLAVSGGCALVAGQLFGSPVALTALCIVWGIAVVADSAQFSAAIGELADPRYVGTALTVQTSLGFLLTLLTIRVVPPLVEAIGWSGALAMLAIGPAFGIWSMLALRRLPEASRMASGRR